MNQLNTFEDKLVVKHTLCLFFGNDGDTMSLSSEPCTPVTLSSYMRSVPDGNDDGDFWM
jgi:hypothetical protein